MSQQFSTPQVLDRSSRPMDEHGEFEAARRPAEQLPDRQFWHAERSNEEHSEEEDTNRQVSSEERRKRHTHGADFSSSQQQQILTLYQSLLRQAFLSGVGR